MAPTVQDFGTLVSLDTSGVRAALRQLVQNMPGQVERALEAEAEIEMAEAKRRTPVRFGPLRASGHVDKAVRGGFGGDEISVTLGFGGPSVPYAAIVHEDLEAFHDVGQAKYLEGPLLESAPFMGQRIAKRLDLNAAVR